MQYQQPNTYGNYGGNQLNGSQFGIIKQKMLNIGPHFQLEDLNGNAIATARQKILVVGKDYQIFDSSGMKIGTVTEQVLKSMVSIHRKYTIRDANGIQVGSTKELQILDRSAIQVFNQMGISEAKFQQEWFNFIRQNWKIRFYAFNIDRRLLIFFPSIISRRQEK